MPLYEFYCEPCHTVFTFRAQKVDTRTVPACPKCGTRLEREISTFAHIVKGATKEAAPEGPEFDEARMDEAMMRMGDRLQALEDDDADPREAVRVMRELADAGGMRFNKDVREAMARIEAGDDPEAIEAEFSEVFDTENPFEMGAEGSQAGTRWWRRLQRPKRDPVWHDFPE